MLELNGYRDKLLAMSPEERLVLLADMTDEEASQLVYSWPFWARSNQIAPPGNWGVWLILSGRGFGKTRSANEWLRWKVETQGVGRIAIIGRTAADVRDTIVEGESGILAVCPPWNKPVYEPSKRRITWPNGAYATTYSAEEPDALRGPQHECAYCDEFAAWKYMQETWDNLMFGMRLGAHPQTVVTTTPRPKKALRDLIKSGGTVVSTGSTYDNAINLPESFFQTVVAKYEGTSLGQQELHAVLLDEMPGALWTRAKIEETRVQVAPNMRRIIVAVDPSVTSTEDSDECGIIVAGKGVDGHGYLLHDGSTRTSPAKWARIAINAYHDYQADRLVAETNNGGDMVELTIHSVDRNVSYKKLTASRGKITRAEPVAALYEQGKCHHVGLFATLEDEFVTYTGDTDEPSPNHLDAAVWAFTELLLEGGAPAATEYMAEENRKIQEKLATAGAPREPVRHGGLQLPGRVR